MQKPSQSFMKMKRQKEEKEEEGIPHAHCKRDHLNRRNTYIHIKPNVAVDNVIFVHAY